MLKLKNIMNIETVQRQSLILLIWQILLTLVGFLSTMYFAHALGASILGSYFLLLTYYNIIGMISDGGLGTAAIKRISEGEEPNEYLTAFFVVRFSFMVMTIILLITFRNYFIDLNGSFYGLLVLLILSGIIGFIGIGNVGSGKIGIHSTCSFIGEVTKLIIQVVSVFLGFGVNGLIGGIIALLLVSSIIEFQFFDLHFKNFGFRHIKNLSSFSFWLFLTMGGASLYSYSDTIMIGYFLVNADVGIYRVIFQFSTAATFISGSLNATLWPKVSRWSKTKDLNLIEESLSRSISFSLLLAIPILIGGIILGDKLLYFFYGAEFSKGYFVLIIILATQIIGILQTFFLSYLSALDHQKSAFKVTSIAGTINIILNYILIPIMGIAGAAIATLITMTLNAILAYRILSKIITIRIERYSILNILKSSFIMSIFVIIYNLFIPSNQLILIPVLLGGMIFIFLILKFDSRIRGDIKNIFIKLT